jgi:hypothetical protein
MCEKFAYGQLGETETAIVQEVQAADGHGFIWTLLQGHDTFDKCFGGKREWSTPPMAVVLIPLLPHLRARSAWSRKQSLRPSRLA